MVVVASQFPTRPSRSASPQSDLAIEACRIKRSTRTEPDQPYLTIIDLPGILRVESDDQSDQAQQSGSQILSFYTRKVSVVSFQRQNL